MSELDNAYKRAIIKLAKIMLEKDVDDLIKALNHFSDIKHFPTDEELERLIKALYVHSKAMDNLARQINLMPRSVRLRP